MEAWIVLMSISIGGHQETHALGYFQTEEVCRGWARMYSAALLAPQQSGTVFGVCWTEEQFRRMKPGMRLELRDS